MEIALKELNQHFSLPPGITCACIADGHCEKTLALLWSIIFHFKVRQCLCAVHVCVCRITTTKKLKGLAS